MNEDASDWAWTTKPADYVAKHVLLTLAERCQPGATRCAPSLPELSHRNGYAVSTNRRALRSLAADGLIQIEEGGGSRGRRSTYTLLVNGEASTEPVPDGLQWVMPRTEAERRRARFHRSPGRLQLRAEIAAGMHVCPCGSVENLQVDHIVPLVADGSDDLENLQVLCGSCNARKGARV